MPGQGFSHTPASGQYRAYNSWGRTRSPKNILSSHRDGTNPAGNPLAVPALAPSGGGAGYETENQKFLHVNILATGGNSADFTVFVFSYACPRWTELKVNDGSGGFQTATEQLAAGASGHFIYNIEGADRVYIQRTDVDGECALTAYLACSTL